MGRITSIETMGLVDGPGIRVVVFLSGCHLRCLYCHNPETWSLEGGKEVSPLELADKIDNYKNYFGNKGGVTFSGGEPLLQPKFLIETMKLCHERGINNCLDTAGVGTDMDEEVLKHTDLVILDIKAPTPELYQKITGLKINKSEEFLSLCQRMNKPLWLRHVVVPGINDTKENILNLKEYVSGIKNVKKIELIPYHTYGKEKYETMGIDYPLKDVPAMDMDRLKELEELLHS